MYLSNCKRTVRHKCAKITITHRIYSKELPDFESSAYSLAFFVRSLTELISFPSDSQK